MSDYLGPTVYPIGPTTAKIMLVGEFPGEQELAKGAPFAGSQGFELGKMLMEAGIFKDSCFSTMVVRNRVRANNIDNLMASTKSRITSEHTLFQGKYVTKQVLDGVAALKKEIELVKPNVIVALGNLALWALTGEWGVNKWRSSEMNSILVPGQKVIPTIHPGIINVQWKWRTLAVHDFKRVKRESEYPEIINVNYDFVIDVDYSRVQEYLYSLWHSAKLEGKGYKVSVDIETRAGHISRIALASSSSKAISIPFMYAGNSEGLYTLREEAEIIISIWVLFQECTIIGQNFNYDAQYILRHWCFQAPHTVQDTMIKHHSLFSNMEKNLSYLSAMYCQHHLHWKDDRPNNPRTAAEEYEEGVYNATDACRTYEINEVLDTVIPAMQMTEVANFQLKLAKSVLKTMDKGVRMDHETRGQFALELIEGFQQREQWLQTVLGHEVNIKSPKQMKELFYDELRQKPIISKKTGNPTCDDEALHRISAREPLLLPITRVISELRSLGVFNSTFVQAPLDTDGRIRTSFNICGTDTYRFASSKNAFGTGLNCQNIPNGGETAEAGLVLPNVRKLFLPDDGHEYFDIDLDSADLRIVTFESDCKWMKEQFAAGRKPYVEVAKEYYHDQTITKHHPAYPMFKALCHGTNYLGTAAGIAPRIGLLVHETERIQKWFYGMCPEIKQWQDRIKDQVSRRRYITNAFGYRFNFFDRIEGTIFNQAVAWIPQSTVACLINRAYVAIDEQLSPDVEVLLQVHDSLAGQYPIIGADTYREAIIRCSQIVIPYDDPLIIPVGIKTSTKSWGDCK